MDKSLSSQLRILLKYSAHHWIYALVGGYFLISLLLFTYFNINIAIPCIFKLCTGISCPGCGLTHAFSHLLKFEFHEAWEHNKLVFIVLPMGLYYVGKDFWKYYERSKTE